MKQIYFFLFFFTLSVTFGQQKTTVAEDDSRTLKDKIRLNWNISADRSLVYANQMAKTSNYEDLAFANGAIASLLQFKGETEKSKKKYKTAIYYLSKIPDSDNKKRLTADVYNYGGLAEWNRGNFSFALEKFQEGIKISSQIGDMKQIMKFKANIGLINEAVGNYKEAIKNAKEYLDFIDRNENLYTKTEIINKKSNLNHAIGSAYEGYFMENQTKWALLDSSAYFYRKAVLYSDSYPDNKINAKLSLGNILNWQSDYKNAEKTYYEVASWSIKNNADGTLCIAYYNIGDVNLTLKKYAKALIFYKKSDSIALLKNIQPYIYFKSNCYQAKIYNILKMPALAHKHSKIYLDRLDKFESKLREERLKVNHKQGEENLTAEMLSIEKKYNENLFLNKILNTVYIILFLGIVFFLVKKRRDKNRILKDNYSKLKI